MILEDEQLLFLKMVHAFERVNVNIQQAVITTIGHQVMDTFYVTNEEMRKLKESDFEEFFKKSLMSKIEI